MGIRGKMEPMYRFGFCSDSLTTDFFLLEEHRNRFISSPKKGAKKQDWKVVSVRPTDRFEEVFCAEVEGDHSFTLEDNLLTGNCPYTEPCGVKIQAPEDEE